MAGGAHHRMLRKILIVTLAILLIVSLSGCEFLPNLRQKILGKADDTATQVTKKVEEIKAQIKEKKDAVDKKMKEAQTAVVEVQEAIDALKKLTGGLEKEAAGTTAGTGTK